MTNKDSIAKIIQARLRIPIMKNLEMGMNAEPLDTVPIQPYVDVSKTLELFYLDMQKVLTNGSIHYFGDEYYCNSRAIDESMEIKNRWFR